ncbi:MAG: hypothetical protein E6I38_10470 [Chloroflexi bacterium]|nr:MAG: hypothetical protein E6I38_10470 [Chloroflexota bacterium]
MSPLLEALACIAGVALVVLAITSALRVLVVPRSSRDRVARTVFGSIRRLFEFSAMRYSTYAETDRLMSWYAPSGLLLLVIVWLAMVLLGYTGIFLLFTGNGLHDSFILSGSSLLTLGFASPGEDAGTTAVAFSEAAIGLILIALLIAYLPAVYSTFSRREALVGMLEVRAGSPPSSVELLARYQRIQWLGRLGDLWERWEAWFVELEETHTSLAALNFFRSPRPERSWITAAGTVLDAAALASSTIDIPRDSRADLCIRAGYLALQNIASFFGIPHDAHPRADDPISISRAEFDAAYDRLLAADIPLKADRDDCWKHFAGWRVNYDTVLLALAELTAAPIAEWVSDRGPVKRPQGL